MVAPTTVKEEAIWRKNPVDPSVTIEAIKKFSFAVYNVNRYIVDAREVQSSSLTPVQRGHVYKVQPCDDFVYPPNVPAWKVTSLRICDSETHMLVGTLESLKNGDREMREGRWAGKADHPKALEFSFLLTEADLALFQERVEEIGGIIQREAPVTTMAAQELYDELVGAATEFERIWRAAQDTLALLGQNATLKEFENLLQEVARLERCRNAAYEILYELNKLTSKATQDPPTLVYIEALCAAARTQSEPMQVLNLPSFHAVVKQRMEAVLAKAQTTIAQLFPLPMELARLARIYPVLERVVAVDNQTISVLLPDLTVTISPTKIDVAGSQEALRTLAQGLTVREAPCGEADRFAQLLDQPVE